MQVTVTREIVEVIVTSRGQRGLSGLYAEYESLVASVAQVVSRFVINHYVLRPCYGHVSAAGAPPATDKSGQQTVSSGFYVMCPICPNTGVNSRRLLTVTVFGNAAKLVVTGLAGLTSLLSLGVRWHGPHADAGGRLIGGSRQRARSQY